jgi:probable rRNA maturation factor
MEVMTDNRSGTELPLARVEKLAAFVLERETHERKRDGEGLELSFSFVTSGEMAQLNAQYRGKQGPTDVLSFELDDPWAPPPEQGAEGVLIGDVVICPDVAREHAERDGITFDEQLWILAIHGTLHLLGYDHEDAKGARLMEAREDDYLRQWELEQEAR